MTRKIENQFISSVHKHFVDVRPHFEKQFNPYRSGTADVWYSGSRGDLWVEYKYSTIPARPGTRIIPDFSPQQLDWLTCRLQEGRKVAVIMGTPDGGVVIPANAWESGVPAKELRALLQSRRDLAHWISDTTGPRAVSTFYGGAAS